MIGRGAERGALATALAHAREGEGTAVLLTGEAGIGKTSLLAAAREDAASMRVAEARMAEPEAGIAYAGLSAIAASIPDAMAGISEEARGVLEGILGLGPPRMADPLAVAGAVLALLSGAAAERPLVVIVDDAQWLDPETTVALMLCARRISHDPICLLAAGRSPAIEASPLMASCAPIPVAELSADQARALLDDAALDLAPQVGEAILATARGNPLALTEIARALSAGQRNGSAPLPDPLPSGPHLEALYAARAAGLSADARTGLLILAASADEDPDRILTAMPDPAALVEARAAGLIGPEGLAFVHPLMRSGVYGAADPAARREAHRRLAEALTDDPPARARHLAAAQVEADEQVAAELEAAGMLAMARLGTSSAVGLLARSAELSVTSEVRVGRLTAAAQAAFMGGAFAGSLELLGAALVEGPSGTALARVEQLRGQVRTWLGPVREAEETFVAAARGIAADDPALGASLLLDAAFVVGGMIGETTRAEQIAEEACVLAAGAGQPLETVARFVLDFTRCLQGAPLAGMAAYYRALEQVVPLIAPLSIWLSFCGQSRAFCDRPLDSVSINAALASRYRAAGLAVGAIFPELSVGIGLVRAGRLTEARSTLAANVGVAEELQLGPHLGLGLAFSSHAAALTGDPAALELARRAREVGAASHTHAAEHYAAHAVATAHMVQGRYSDAVPVLEGMKDALWGRLGMESIDLCPFGSDLVEALVAAGRGDEARDVAHRLELQSERAESLNARAHANRAAALVAETQSAATALFVESIATGDDAGCPVDSSRTRLLFAQRLAAGGAPTEAKAVAREALHGFQEAGATPLAERCRLLLARLGDGNSATSDERAVLSPQEMQVALLVAEGLSNTEIGGRLFITRRTVEFHLTNTYRKLGVRGRTALAAEMARQPGQGAPT